MLFIVYIYVLQIPSISLHYTRTENLVPSKWLDEVL